ncbi:TrbI/VirB10 family protein [Terriglobus albidus]|uniref:TrbI/VirB10 family protein n=1 Tax=Terriglobus albidus TaxID=1592106 RepID=UPI0021E05461|nr:TrbI/VirB10 family protein [Terriglobus albidus]
MSVKHSVSTAALLLSIAPMFAQQSGVSVPPKEDYTQDAAPQKPSAAKPVATVPPALGEEPAPAPAPVQTMPAPVAAPKPAPAAPAPTAVAELKTHVDADPDSGVVTYVPSPKGELPQGTLIRVQLNDEISTTDTPIGAPFHARVAQDVSRDGHVVIPAGAEMIGRVTEVRGGKRIRGAALIHLEPQQINLPDGTHFVVHAQVIDTDQQGNARIGSEGNIVRRDHAKGTLAAMGLTTGGATAAGAMVGGGVGALVGAGIGAGASTVVWLKQDRQLTIMKDSTIDFALSVPMMTTPLHN